jgi:nitrous oxide reductase accessory protein NosL
MSNIATKTNPFFIAALAAVAAFAAGCNSASIVTTPAPVVPQAARATVDLCGRTSQGCSPSGASVSMAAARDLVINVSWTNVPAGTHTQTLEVIEPDGGLYEAKTQAFAIEDSSSGSVQTEEVLPLSGTAIAQRQLLGPWTLRVSLDTTMSVSQTVQLTQ